MCVKYSLSTNHVIRTNVFGDAAIRRGGDGRGETPTPTEGLHLPFETGFMSFGAFLNPVAWEAAYLADVASPWSLREDFGATTWGARA